AGTITASLTGTALRATNLASGSAYKIPYQTAANTTAFLGNAAYFSVLSQSNSSSAPAWFPATNDNTPSTIVGRDASGNFSAGTITAALSGNATSATNIAGGGANRIPYNTGSGA